jgi:hypothetical protein
MHLHRSGHALHQSYVLWHRVEMDPHGNALSKPDPRKNRVPLGHPGGVRLRVRNVDCPA